MIENKYQNIITNNIQECQQIREKKDGWQEVKKGKYLTLSNTKYLDYELKLLKLEGIIPTNFEKVANYFADNLEQQKQSREMCDELRIIEQVDQNTKVILFRTKGKLIVSSREILGVQHKRQINPNEYLILRGHLDDHPAAPKDADSIRADGKIYALYITSNGDNSTKLQAFMLMDPKGNIPVMIFNAMCEEQLNGFELDISNILKQ